MSSEENVTCSEKKSPVRSQSLMVMLAQLLVVGAFIALAVGFWHRSKVEALQERFRERYGVIDVPEAFGFLGMALSVLIPVLLVWFGLQLTSVIVYCVNRTQAGLIVALAFWTLWTISCFGVIELTFALVFG